MKKLFIIGLGLVLGSTAFHASAQTAQSAANDKIRFGIKAGANLMKMGKFQFGGQDYSTDYKIGFQAGVYADLPMGGNFAFLPEITFTQKGGKLKETVADNTGEFDSKVSYIDVPLMIGYKATPELTVFAGPQVSFLVDQTSTIKVNGEETLSSSDKDDWSKSIAGGAIGLNYSISPNVSINGRYTMDFQKALKDNAGQDKIKNSGFALSLGYTF